MLAYNVSNDKLVVTKGRTSFYTSTSSISSNEIEETPAESSKGSNSSNSRSIFSRNKSELSTESNTLTSLKMDKKGWKNY